ncbi:hypothetical protein [Pedobacter sp. Hv1]|uniref:hypothetical protein n=1 Tax=Pedobacter sp. Hv1 TaxID=1740090 RepID=UPI0006D88E82|nr:hypothetical protein [Pedobacter sp. Hv1]KQB99944.1 hypothetical protein AQF98_15665 [Pedobacter sp. Hv1]
MIEEYQEEILVAYKKLKPNLSHDLQNPTPANLRDEAVKLYEERQDGREILLKFSEGNYKGSENVGIGKLDIDKFRPVNHFLIDKTSNPNRRVVELVAWLINFEPRPFDTWKETKVGGSNSGGGIVISPLPPQPPQPVPSPSFLEKIIQWLEREPNAKKKKFIVALVPVTLIALASYTFFEHISTQCMYWTGNEYQSVGCSVKVDHATVIALDRQKLVGLKKINRLDTITEKDLGRVWYVKIKQDSAEFYTDSGNYPLNNKKVLMPMTKYILDKYILHK